MFYISPFVGLILTYVADRSPGNTIFVYACTSTAMLCPLIFGFPTEMWLAHAIFWPVLALSHYARPTVAASMLVFVAQLLLAFTHEGALVLLLAIVATLAPRGLRSTPFVRAATCLIIILIMATISKIAFPPDDYYASAFWRAALHFFDLEIFKVRVVLLLLAALTAYGAILACCLSGHRGELASTRSESCLDCFPPTGCTLIIRCTLAAVTIFGLCW